MTDTQKKCEFCDKRGLPLLLVRSAVAPAGAGAPRAPEREIGLPAEAAHYTTRLLRSGYLNVHDEARKRWETYFVTQDGYFFKLSQTPGVTPPVPAKPFNCPDQGHRAVASCITIPDPARATKVWIGFSDVLWTDAVRKANEDPAYRHRHMTSIDVKALLAGGQDPYARPIAQVSAVVAEYGMDARKGATVFGWSPAAFNARLGQAERLVNECESLRPGKGRIVTIADPAGIVQDIAFLMKRNAELFTSKPEYQRNLAASAAIGEIENAVRRQAELDEVAAAEQMADQQVSMNPLGHWLSESTRQRTEELRDVTETEAKRAADNAWSKYARKFDNAARLAWMRNFNQSLDTFDQKFIGPLARSHVAWMKSAGLASHFECNYDRDNVDTGVVYTAVMTHCIATTQDKKACADLYDEWLNGDMADTKNLLLQAMVLNQKVVADAVKSATTVSIDLRQIPWDNLFASYTNSVKRVSEHSQEVLARFIVEFAGPVARMFGKIMDGSAGFRAAVMATGLIAGHPVVVCEVTGGRKQFRAHVIRQLQRASGQVISENKMRSAVAAELRRQQIHGAPMEGTTTKKWLILADKEMISQMPPGLSPKQRADWLARSISTVEKIEGLNLQRWRTVISRDVRFGVVAGILQAASLTKTIADQEKALANEKNDATLRLHAGIATVSATTAEVIGNLIANRAAQGLRYGQGLMTVAGDFLKRWGGRAGMMAGLFVAGLDLVKGVTEYRENASGLVVASYISMAVVGASLTLALFATGFLGAAAIPIIGILILLLIGIGLLLEYIKDNPVQDWLERCPWGALPGQRYPDFKTEQDQLMQALK
jgi:hypothetical protein